MEHTATFFERLVVGIMFVGRSVESRMVDKVVVAMMVADKIIWYF